MTASGFDRLRPRHEGSVATTPVGTGDSEGKRALFSSADTERPVGAGITIECARCKRRTQISPAAALRAAFPALHLSLTLGYGERETTVGVLRNRKYGSWLRCPACGRAGWARVTVRL